MTAIDLYRNLDMLMNKTGKCQFFLTSKDLTVVVKYWGQDETWYWNEHGEVVSMNDMDRFFEDVEIFDKMPTSCGYRKRLKQSYKPFKS